MKEKRGVGWVGRMARLRGMLGVSVAVCAGLGSGMEVPDFPAARRLETWTCGDEVVVGTKPVRPFMIEVGTRTNGSGSEWEGFTASLVTIAMDGYTDSASGLQVLGVVDRLNDLNGCLRMDGSCGASGGCGSAPSLTWAWRAYESNAPILSDLALGAIDMGAAAITVTEPRKEGRLFVNQLQTGLYVVAHVSVSTASGITSVLGALFSVEAFLLLLSFGLIVVTLGSLAWASEKFRPNESRLLFDDENAANGIAGGSFWALTAVLGLQPYKAQSPLTKVLMILFVILGAVFNAVLIGGITNLIGGTSGGRDVTTMDHLRAHTVCTILDTAPHQYLKALGFPGSSFRFYPSVDAMLAAFDAGDCKGLVYDAGVVTHFMQSATSNDLKLIGDVVNDQWYGVFFSPTVAVLKREFEDVFHTMRDGEDNVFDRLKQFWLAPPDEEIANSTELATFAWIALGTLAAFVGVGALLWGGHRLFKACRYAARVGEDPTKGGPGGRRARSVRALREGTAHRLRWVIWALFNLEPYRRREAEEIAEARAAKEEDRVYALLRRAEEGEIAWKTAKLVQEVKDDVAELTQTVSTLMTSVMHIQTLQQRDAGGEGSEDDADEAGEGAPAGAHAVICVERDERDVGDSKEEGGGRRAGSGAHPAHVSVAISTPLPPSPHRRGEARLR